jgi:hypothetical protein
MPAPEEFIDVLLAARRTLRGKAVRYDKQGYRRNRIEINLVG